jgi:hypothetical protein
MRISLFPIFFICTLLSATVLPSLADDATVSSDSSGDQEFIGISRPAPVTEIEVPISVNEGKDLIIVIKGTLSSSAFMITSIPYTVEDSTITVTPIMGNNPNAGMLSVTVNYTETVRIPGLKTGPYSVLVKGEGANFTAKTEVVKCEPGG